MGFMPNSFRSTISSIISSCFDNAFPPAFITTSFLLYLLMYGRASINTLVLSLRFILRCVQCIYLYVIDAHVTAEGFCAMLALFHIYLYHELFFCHLALDFMPAESG